MDPNDIFSSLFGGGGGGRGGKAAQRKGKDVLFKLKVTLADLYSGGVKTLRLSKSTICESCQGKGGSKVIKCNACKGQGVRIIIRQLGPGMIQQMQAHCDECSGKGEIINPKDRCKGCAGEKVIKAKKTLEVQIERGMSDGSKIVFRQESDQSPGIIPGDVIVVLEQDEHPTFRRDGMQLFMKKKISLADALAGVSFNVETLDGRVLAVSSGLDPRSIVSSGSIKCIRDEGMPSQKNPTQTGHLYIEFDVEFPKTLSPAARQKLVKLLPASKPQPQPEVQEDSRVESALLENCNMETEALGWKDDAKRHGGEAYEEDGEEEGGRGQAAQCRAQ